MKRIGVMKVLNIYIYIYIYINVCVCIMHIAVETHSFEKYGLESIRFVNLLDWIMNKTMVT